MGKRRPKSRRLGLREGGHQAKHSSMRGAVELDNPVTVMAFVDWVSQLLVAG